MRRPPTGRCPAPWPGAPEGRLPRGGSGRGATRRRKMNFKTRRWPHASGFAWHLALTLLAGAALQARPATAQDTGRWEVGAFTGGYFGSRTFLDQNTDIEIGKSAAFGLRGAFSVDRTFSLHATLSRASARLAAVNPSTGASLAPS